MMIATFHCTWCAVRKLAVTVFRASLTFKRYGYRWRENDDLIVALCYACIERERERGRERARVKQEYLDMFCDVLPHVRKEDVSLLDFTPLLGEFL